MNNFFKNIVKRKWVEVDNNKSFEDAEKSKITIKGILTKIINFYKLIVSFFRNHLGQITVVAIGGVIAGYIVKTVKFSHINSLILIIYEISNLLMNFLYSSTKNWYFILLISISLFIIYSIKKFKNFYHKKKLLDYNEDEIDSIKYKWTLEHPNKNIYIEQSCCSMCGCELSIDGLKSYYCPKCKQKFGPVRKNTDIIKIIQQKIEDKFS